MRRNLNNVTRITPYHVRMYTVTDPEAGCVLWQGNTDRNGYGMVRVLGKNVLTHRQMWIQENGPIPEGMELDHLCRNRNCLNLEHLELVTRAENMKRQWDVRKGEANDSN